MTAGLTLRTQTVGIRPEFDHVRVLARRAVRTDPKAPTPRARQINARPLRSATLSWREATEGVRSEVRRLFAASSGCVLPFNYTPVGKTDAEAFEVQIVPGSMRMRRAAPLLSPGRHEIEFEVEEVL